MPKVCNFIKKETLAQVFSCDFTKYLKSLFSQNISRRLLLHLTLMTLICNLHVLFVCYVMGKTFIKNKNYTQELVALGNQVPKISKNSKELAILSLLVIMDQCSKNYSNFYPWRFVKLPSFGKVFWSNRHSEIFSLYSYKTNINFDSVVVEWFT